MHYGRNVCHEDHITVPRPFAHRRQRRFGRRLGVGAQHDGSATNGLLRRAGRSRYAGDELLRTHHGDDRDVVLCSDGRGAERRADYELLRSERRGSRDELLRAGRRGSGADRGILRPDGHRGSDDDLLHSGGCGASGRGAVEGVLSVRTGAELLQSGDALRRFADSSNERDRTDKGAANAAPLLFIVNRGAIDDLPSPTSR